jgi:hypothetical protein
MEALMAVDMDRPLWDHPLSEDPLEASQVEHHRTEHLTLDPRPLEVSVELDS